jgi:hypothetical protein
VEHRGERHADKVGAEPDRPPLPLDALDLVVVGADADLLYLNDPCADRLSLALWL